MAAGNKLLGEFNLEGIPPAPRGVPQIEVTFDIDANGILHVGAKDKATGKENKITIKANSGLTEQEIEKMVKEAELHADEDRKLKELADARNKGDALVHSVRKALSEYGDKVEQAEKERVDTALQELEQALKANDKSVIESKIQALSTAAQKLGEKMYGETQAQQAASAAAAGAGAQAQQGEGQPQEDVVDAEFKEVKDNK
jgi:molecular chaperone DnaK